MASSLLGSLLARWPTGTDVLEQKFGTSDSFRDVAVALLLWNSIGGMVYLTGFIRWRQAMQVVVGWWKRNSSMSLSNVCSGLVVTMAASALWWSCKRFVRWVQRLRLCKEEDDFSNAVQGGAVSEQDFAHFKKTIFETSGQGWEKIVDKGEGSIVYKAWRLAQRSGPTLYLSKTVLEGISAETMREFYLDDNNRRNWDPCHSASTGLDRYKECNFVRWIRKYPCVSPREYIIARRNWEEDGALFTVTKSAEHPSAVKPPCGMRRVNSFYSSWCIKEVKSTLNPGSKATEVILLHAEDLGISESLARFVIRQGLWTFVKKMAPAVGQYHNRRQGTLNSEWQQDASLESAVDLERAAPVSVRKVLVSAVGAAAVASGVGVPLAGATYLAALAVVGHTRATRS